MKSEQIQKWAPLATSVAFLVTVVAGLVERRDARQRYDDLMVDYKKSVALSEETVKLLHQCVEMKAPRPSP